VISGPLMSRLDRSKLCAWFAAQGPALVLFARQCLQADHREAAEDVVQEVFVRLLARTAERDSHPEPPNPAAWLHRCVRNACLDEQRGRRRRSHREKRAAATRWEWFDARPHDLIDANTARELLESLEEMPRQILVLRIWSGLTLDEAAEVTGLPRSTIFDHYKQSLARLRRAMESKRGARVGKPNER
jgi:RNA polymerase sigma-70 factor (ECF subfamily)